MQSDISIELVDHMGDDLRIANVARVSFNKWKEELDDKDVKLIQYLAAHEHTSPFRHNSITLRCKAPLFLARQLGKHQVGLSWNEVSRRYVDDEPEFYYPDEWRARPEGGIKQGSGDKYLGDEPFGNFCELPISYNEYVMLGIDLYTDMLRKGIAPEMARMVLPQSMMTTWIWTGSLQAFFHVWRLRIDGHAQKEAQDFAQKLDDVISPIFPNSWEALKYSG